MHVIHIDEERYIALESIVAQQDQDGAMAFRTRCVTKAGTAYWKLCIILGMH